MKTDCESLDGSLLPGVVPVLLTNCWS